ncbi:uncharacterized protein LOC141860906 [Acropora palmata]|uniref:uncharacterized protein LOC141860906 n=1 Tax=Acropora palmata TaxID=6131 RepID=UPI003DA0C1CC
MCWTAAWLWWHTTKHHACKRVGEGPHPMRGPQLLILQKLGLSKRQIVGAWLSGNEIDPEEIIRNIKLNLQNMKAIKTQRQMLEDKRTQDAELKLLETAYGGKEVHASPAAAGVCLSSAERASVTAVEAPAATDTVPTASSTGEAAVGYTASGTDNNIISLPPVRQHRHISVKVIKPSGRMVMLTVAETRCIGSILTSQERDTGVKVRVYSGDNISVVVPTSTVFKDIVGNDKQILLRLERE